MRGVISRLILALIRSSNWNLSGVRDKFVHVEMGQVLTQKKTKLKFIGQCKNCSKIAQLDMHKGCF